MIGTDIELMVAEWLEKRNILFSFQTKLLGGRPEFGGAVVDFILIEEGIILRVQGEYWHTDTEQTAQDKVQRILLENLGYRVVDLQETDIENNIDAVMNRAVVGLEMSPIDTDLFTGNIGASKGSAIGLIQPTADIPGTHTTPNIMSGRKELFFIFGGSSYYRNFQNITRSVTDSSFSPEAMLTYDGGIECDVNFKWGTATEESNDFGFIFPFNFMRSYELLESNVTKSLVVVDSYINETPIQRHKITDDYIYDSVGNLESEIWYNWKAIAKNPDYSNEGSDMFFKTLPEGV